MAKLLSKEYKKPFWTTTVLIVQKIQLAKYIWLPFNSSTIISRCVDGIKDSTNKAVLAILCRVSYPEVHFVFDIYKSSVKDCQHKMRGADSSTVFNITGAGQT